MKKRASYFRWLALVVVLLALFAPSVVSSAAGDGKTDPEPDADDAAEVCGKLIGIVFPDGFISPPFF